MASCKRIGLLQGHTDSILCCEMDTEGKLVITGSEDCSASVFDIRSPERVHNFKQFGQDAVAAVCFNPVAGEHILLAAAGATVHTFDLRQGSSAEPLHRYSFNSDEISSIAVNRRGSFLAASDDSGQVKVVDLERNQLYKTLRGGHSNICSSVQFHPRRPWEVVTGGLDARAVKWDFSAGRIRHTWNFADEAVHSEQGLGSLCNPPLVHAVAVPPPDTDGQAGKLFAVARGDGVVALYDLDFEGRKMAKPARGKERPKGRAGRSGVGKGARTDGGLAEAAVEAKESPSTERVASLDGSRGGHLAPVSHVVFARFAADCSLLISGGNDRQVVVWDWTKAEVSQEGSQGSQELAGSPSSAQPEAVRIRHGKKVNWLCTSGNASENLGVADTSKSVSLYSIS